MGKKRKSSFVDNAWLTDQTYCYYLERLCNIATSVYDWKNLPDTMDARFLETTIFTRGMCLVFQDDVVGELGGDSGTLCLPCTIGGTLDIYNVPMYRHAYANNGYHADRDRSNSVIVYHDYMHTIPYWNIQMFARRLADMQQTIDVNIHAQKTPIVVVCDDNNRLTFENIMMQYEGNTPLMFGTKGLDVKNAIQVLKTDAPFVADQIEELRVQVWNDAMTYMGISNVNVTKKERLITDEVQRNMGGTLASRYSPLDMRRQAAEKINKMFDLNIDVDFREDILAYQSQILGETADMIEKGELDGE